MTREIKSDLAKLEDFIRYYSISQSLDNPDFVKSLKRMHKCYMSLLTFNFEFAQLHEDGKVPEWELSEDLFNYLFESISDVGNSLFCWIHGAYKPSRLSLRCSIENFVRAVGSLGNTDILNEKIAYKLFEKASEITFFQTPEISKKSFSDIHNNYKALCADVHTADKGNMVHLSALKFFPHFEKNVAVNTEVILASTTKSFLTVLCILFKKQFFLMHHRNMENILSSLDIPVRRYIRGL